MNYNNPTQLQAAILDWAGTVVDFGSFAPTQIFVEAFAEFDVQVSIEEARGPMGMGKTPNGIVGCSKHWAGDGQASPNTSSKGAIVDRGNIMIDEPTMRKFGIAPYLGAIQAGLGSIMVSDARWNATRAESTAASRNEEPSSTSATAA